MTALPSTAANAASTPAPGPTIWAAAASPLQLSGAARLLAVAIVILAIWAGVLWALT